MVLLYATALFIGKQLPPASVRLSTSAHQCPLLYDTATFTVNPSNCLTIKVWHTVRDTSGQTLGTPSIAPPQICLHSQAYACLHVRKSPGAGPSICHSYVFCQSPCHSYVYWQSPRWPQHKSSRQLTSVSVPMCSQLS